MPASPWMKMFLGVIAGLISAVAGLIIAYVVGVAAIAYSTQELPATLLASVTVLPLMLLIVFLPLELIITVTTGLLLGAGSHFRNRTLGVVAGALVGLLCAEIVLSLLVPLVIPPKPDDFIHIISNPYLSAACGIVLGSLTGLFFRLLNRGRVEA
jgi:uncharacterized membrane protein required for colicin V production